MLDNQTTNHGWHKKDPWVKALKSAYKPDEIADLIKNRLENPKVHGPWITNNEEASDIIDMIIKQDENNRRKIVPAIGLLLHNLLHDKTPENHDLLRGVFDIIGNNRIKECASLLRKWLIAKKSAMESDISKWMTTYRSGMCAYAYVQEVGDDPIKEWWYNVWKNGSQFWWSTAFIGMRIQSPELAARELKTLIERNYDKAGYVLAAMWSDERSRKEFEREIVEGLEENTGWAGRALNLIVEKLKEDKQKELLLGLKRLVYCV